VLTEVLEALVGAQSCAFMCISDLGFKEVVEALCVESYLNTCYNEWYQLSFAVGSQIGEDFEGHLQSVLRRSYLSVSVWTLLFMSSSS
jgi:hypothetical protein